MSLILKFDRTPVARLVSCAATFGSAALLFDYMSHGAKEIEPLSFAGLFILFLGTLAAAIVQYGDHIYFSEQGVMYENRLLSLFGKRGPSMRRRRRFCPPRHFARWRSPAIGAISPPCSRASKRSTRRSTRSGCWDTSTLAR